MFEAYTISKLAFITSYFITSRVTPLSHHYSNEPSLCEAFSYTHVPYISDALHFIRSVFKPQFIHYTKYAKCAYLLLFSIDSTHSSVPFLHATADDIPATTEKGKVFHYLEACFQVLTTTNGPLAKAINVNVQLYVLSHIPDNFEEDQRTGKVPSQLMLTKTAYKGVLSSVPTHEFSSNFAY